MHIFLRLKDSVNSFISQLSRLNWRFVLKKFWIALLLIFFGFRAYATVSTLVADVQSGYVLHATNADKKQYPASLTKVMTLYITFDALEKGLISMDDLLPVSQHAAKQPKSKLYLKAGSVISVREAILALIVKSANDAAVVLAEALAPSEEEFAKMMTQFARDLGLTDTTFKNASGLHDPEQVTSAKDMAILAIAVINHFPQYYPLFSTKSFKFHGRTYYSHNAVLLYYKGAQGFKTGFISAVGYNVVSTAARDGRTLVGVVIGQNSAEKRDRQMRTLLDKGFKKAKEKQAQLAGLGNNPFLQKAFISKSHRDIYDPVLIASVQKTRERVSEIAEQGNLKLIASIPTSSFEDNTIEVEQGDYTPADSIEQGDNAPANWGIQVGAFSTKAKAEQHAQKVQKLLHATNTQVQTPQHTGLFRSRLTGFETKEDAIASCKKLSAQAISCITVAPKANKH